MQSVYSYVEYVYLVASWLSISGPEIRICTSSKRST